MSLAAVATSRPSQVLLVRGHMPIEVRCSVGLNALAYASEPGILRTALGIRGWGRAPLDPGEALVVRLDGPAPWKRRRFRFPAP